MSGGPLVIAVPSKGRLQENAAGFFARAGLDLNRVRGERDYRGTIAGLGDAEVLFLSAAEIVAQLASGGAHLGVTGEDLLHEALPAAERDVEVITGLGFGFANVVVAVPQTWIDVRTMADLDEVAGEMRARHGRRLRVATKYANLTRRHFARLGVGDYRIVESLGATEGAPASGAADLIVDITTTGATLAANGLKILEDGVILRSQASLIASMSANWDGRAHTVARTVLSRISAQEEARTTREVRAGIDPARADMDDLIQLYGATLPFGLGETPPLILHCRTTHVFDLVEALIGAGAKDVTVGALDYVFRTKNAMAERLFDRLERESARS